MILGVLSAQSLPLDGYTSMALAVLFIPLVTFVYLMLFGRIVNRYRGYLASGMMLICAVFSSIIFYEVWSGHTHHTRVEWFSFGDQAGFTLGISLDCLSSLMLVVVSFISFLVHLFSIEYLRGDRNFEKYFSYLGLFTFSMTGIVLSDNLLVTFMFWELVGFSSYLLIGFWFTKDSASNASKKAFIVNRVGDAGFMLGILILWSLFGTLDLELLPQLIYNHVGLLPHSGGLFHSHDIQGVLYSEHTWMMVAGIGLFLGCVGKSAQFPLHVWLPDAMEGPTPVSALIHAATMVAAGVYLLARVFVFMPADVLTIVAIVGIITALIGAFSAIAQYDIKRVLAFSTISQLGYMVMGIGVGAYDAALFHLLTHAFFKACLFLSSGAVIHAMHHVEHSFPEVHFDPQDMRNMGGMRKSMPVVFVCYFISTCSLVGLPLFSGFLSKDAILLSAWSWAEVQQQITGNSWYFMVPIAAFSVVFFTAFYMSRQLWMVFFGEFKLTSRIPELKVNLKKYVHDAPFLMRIPIVLLAIMSLWFVFSVNPFDSSGSWFMEKITTPLSVMPEHLSAMTAHRLALLKAMGHLYHLSAAMFSVFLAAGGILAFYLIYVNRYTSFLHNLHDQYFKEESFIHKLSENQLYINQLYMVMIVKPVLFISSLASGLDRLIIDPIVNVTAPVVLRLAKLSLVVDRSFDFVVDYVGRVSWQLGGNLRRSHSAYIQVLISISVLLSLLLLLIWWVR